MRASKKDLRFTSYPLFMTLTVFVFVLLATQVGAYWIYKVEKASELQQVKAEALHLKGRLEASLNHSITATRVLAILVEKDLIRDSFDTICEGLLRQNKFMDALQLVEGSTIISTYPLHGNEATIGYNIREDAKHQEEARKARQRGNLYFEGPFSLIQGGEGVVGRFPIYKSGTFWGFSAVVIRLETLLDALGLDRYGRSDKFIYQLAKSTDEKGLAPFFPHRHTAFDDGIHYQVEVPLGDWIIYVKAISPRYLKRALPISILGFLLSVLLAYFTWQLSLQPEKLRKQVKEKTLALEELNAVLEERARQLMVSNSELEQFAYVASHDLQEPLRMVTSFLSQLEKKYNHLLDEKARQYIRFAVDGATRMRRIILDLLDFSRINSLDEPAEKLDCKELLREVLALNQQTIEETRATIHTRGLPVILAHRSVMVRILHNLIGNALKYTQKDRKPVITVSAKELKHHWEFGVKDNGMGIEEAYFEKIFIIFQRLHHTREQGGTGMGLAMVKKMVESIGGRIWVKSEYGKGSAFYFTIPKPKSI